MCAKPTTKLQTPINTKDILRDMPSLPGVYRFIGDEDKPLYVGKAANLKKRVAQYFQSGRKSPRHQLMMNAMRRVEVTVTASEHAALLLENNLIKSLRPRYNILFRDDKSYPCLRLSAHAYPRLHYARGAANDDDSFGPFPDSHAVRESVNMLQRIFHLRTCTDSVFANRSRPCLLHSIGRCSAPCVNLITPNRYASDVIAAKQLLGGDSQGVEDDLRQMMEKESAAQEYEKAAILRDRLRALTVMRERHFVDAPGTPDADYVGVFCGEGGACVNVVMVRGGRRLGEMRHFSSCPPQTTDSEVLTAFISQHYATTKSPPQIIPSCRPQTMPADALAKLSKLLKLPQRDEQKRRVMEATNNAKIAWQLRQSQNSAAAARLQALAKQLDMPPPQRIECFDVSHSAGESPVASRAVFVDGAPATAHYRRYHIKAKGGDDAASIYEAVMRSCTRAVKEESPLPDLLLIDGGVTQLRAARRAMHDAAVSFPLLAVAKGASRKAGREKLITADGEVLTLPETDPGFHLIQAVRDEAHRFAVSGHRKQRDKKRRVSSLEGIEGIGTKRRRQLLSLFGGLRGIKAAGEAELVKIKGISPQMAKRIYESLHQS